MSHIGIDVHDRESINGKRVRKVMPEAQRAEVAARACSCYEAASLGSAAVLREYLVAAEPADVQRKRQRMSLSSRWGMSSEVLVVGSPSRTRTCDLVINSGGAAKAAPHVFSGACGASL